jgi:flagellar hook-associated protein 3 FlgL
MQVSTLTAADQLAGELDSDTETINSLDEELSSGIALQKPSDNPTGVADVIGYNSQLSEVTSLQANATTAQSWLGLGNDTANSVISTLQEVQTTVLQALSTGSNNATTYDDMATEVQGVITQMVGFANTQLGSTPIFAGTAGVGQPYSSTGTYSGNSQPFTINVGTGAPVAVSVPGDQMFGGGTSGIQSVFTTLQNVVTHLQAGPGAATSAGLETDLGDLDANLSQSESAATTLGESTDQVSAATTAAENTATQLQTILSSTDDTDIPTVTAELQTDLTNYQSALYAVSQAVPETLAKFLN